MHQRERKTTKTRSHPLPKSRRPISERKKRKKRTELSP